MIRHHALLEPLIERVVHVFAERPLWLLTAAPLPVAKQRRSTWARIGSEAEPPDSAHRLLRPTSPRALALSTHGLESHALPMPSPSASAWLWFHDVGQLSEPSQTLSQSVSVPGPLHQSHNQQSPRPSPSASA